MKVIFFNHFHNGDIHVSRGFVRQIMKRLPEVSFAYSHRNYAGLLADIPGLDYDPNACNIVRNEHVGLMRVGDTVYMNTWYAQQNHKYMNKYGITMDALYEAFDDHCRSLWGFSLQDISSDPSVFFPSIDYSNFHIKEAQIWLNQNPERKIFVSNGKALSGQADNFDMTAIINRVAVKHPSTIFILSNQESPVTAPNIIYSSSIIKKPSGSDLNENAFLSEHCDVIMGRASGAFAFAETYNNMLNRKCKFVCFSNLVPPAGGQFWFSSLLQNKIKYVSDVIVTNESNPQIVQQIMEQHVV
jgi:hypothetical protein